MGFSFSGRSPLGSPKPRPRATLHRWRRPCRRQIGHACFHVWTQGAFLTFKRLSFFQPMTPHSLLFQWHAAKFQQFNLIRFFVWPNLRSKCKIHWGFLLHSPCSPCENVILLIWWWIKLSWIEYAGPTWVSRIQFVLFILWLGFERKLNLNQDYQVYILWCCLFTQSPGQIYQRLPMPQGVNTISRWEWRKSCIL